MEGHGHNIPAVDISPCGKYIASASVDSTVRLWNLRTGKLIVEGKLPQWGWAVKFIKKDSIVDCYLPNNIDYVINRLNGVECDEYHEQILNRTFVPNASLSDSSEVMEELIGSSESEEDDIEWVDEEDEEDVQPEVQVDMKTPEKPTLGDDLNERLQKSTAQCPHGPFQSRISKSVEEETSDGSEYLIFASTQDALILFDHNMVTLSSLAKVLDKPYNSLFGFYPMIRLALVQYIPEISTLLVANQGSFSLLIMTLRFNLNTNEYEFIPEIKLPQQRIVSNVVGMCCHRVEEDVYNIYLMFQSGNVIVHQMHVNREDMRYNIETMEV